MNENDIIEKITTPKEFFEWATKYHLLATIGEIQNLDDVEIENPHAVEKGKLDLDACMNVRIRDKLEYQMVRVGDEVEKYLLGSALETPKNMNLSVVEFIRRQKWRFDHMTITVTLERPNQKAFLVEQHVMGHISYMKSRDGVETDYAKRFQIADKVVFTINLAWI